MLSRRTVLRLGATLLSPFVAQIPATVEARAEPVIDPELEMEITLGPIFEGVVSLRLNGYSGECVVAGEVRARRINGLCFIVPDGDLRAKLNEGERREIAALEAAGLPSVEVV